MQKCRGLQRSCTIRRLQMSYSVAVDGSRRAAEGSIGATQRALAHLQRDLAIQRSCTQGLQRSCRGFQMRCTVAVEGPKGATAYRRLERSCRGLQRSCRGLYKSCNYGSIEKLQRALEELQRALDEVLRALGELQWDLELQRSCRLSLNVTSPNISIRFQTTRRVVDTSILGFTQENDVWRRVLPYT